MNTENKICPYPGLRPFNEDEAIFFKGRDMHIEQIVHQLEQKKFLMLTGASGDGKSSLVYAGVIPFARAGFFKAKHNYWVVADFRPERTPLKNFASGLSNALAINDVEKTAKELSYGFSALMDIYQASPYYLDQEAHEFVALPDPEKRKKKRKAANLLILVDQFEEFFTNSENFAHGKPSFESQAVINVLLETAKLAIEKDIPIYIVCTMRSDYIGQCASFRNLPEYLGFSQFFVPRLNRKEIYQVIEEPAMLNGDKISKRLVETLINQLDEGVDQLPVLQHALNQVWQNAENGNHQMDLIHLAKIGGLNKKYLNPADRQLFEDWLQNQPEYKKPYFANPSLDNVLDTHANELLEIAAKAVNDNQGQKIKEQNAKKIIETTFKCLTKIDEGRVVRNRMTLQEITEIINADNLKYTEVGTLLNIYRKQGNTFLKPFITEDAETTTLKQDSILEITHESLIRNWTILTTWTKEEHEDLMNFQDFNKQLQRWVNNKKSSGFLLPIGPLTFFENWFQKSKPNKYWLVKYDEREISNKQKLAEADETLKNANEFIKQSARRLIMNRTILKYGANKILAAFGILIFIISCTYFTLDFRKKQNDYVIKEIERKGIELLKSKNKFVSSENKADFILTEERLKPDSYKMLLDLMPSDSVRLDIITHMLGTCLFNQENKQNNSDNDNPLLGPLFLNQINIMKRNGVFSKENMFIKNIRTITSVVYEHILIKRLEYQPNKQLIDSEYINFCENVFNEGIQLLRDTLALRTINIRDLNRLLNVMPDLVNYDTCRLNKLVNLLTPFNIDSRKTFDILYPKDKKVTISYQDITLTHNGGYFQLANLYALCANFDGLNKSYDSLIYYNKNFVNNTWSDFSYHLFLYDLLINDNLTTMKGQAFIKKIETNIVDKKYDVIINIVNELLAENKKNINSDRVYYNDKEDENDFFGITTQKEHIDYSKVYSLIDFLVIQTHKNDKKSDDEKNFLIALLIKAKAFVNNAKGQTLDYASISNYINESYKYYTKISVGYLNDNMALGEGTNIKYEKRSNVYKIPGNVDISNSTSINYPYNFKNLSIFIDKINSLNDTFYNNFDNEYLNNFLIAYGDNILSTSDEKNNKEPNLKPFLDALNINSEKIDKDNILAFLSIYYHKHHQEGNSTNYAKQINLVSLFNKEKIEKDALTLMHYVRLATKLCVLFQTTHGKNSKSDEIFNEQINNSHNCMEIVKRLPMNFMKRNVLLVAIDSFQYLQNNEQAIALTDTLINNYIYKEPEFGIKLFQLLGRYSADATNKIALHLIQDQTEELKPTCYKLFITGLCESNNYYVAYTSIPDNISFQTQLSFYATILRDKIQKSENNSGWRYSLNQSNYYMYMNLYETKAINGRTYSFD